MNTPPELIAEESCSVPNSRYSVCNIQRMKTLQSLLGGAAGAMALTAIHQAGKATLPHAPRADVLGRRIIAKPVRALGGEPPVGGRLQGAALAVDLLSNSLWYALLGLGARRHLWRNASLLGLAAGIGAVAVPPILGLGSKPTARTNQTIAMTITYYLLGGLAAACTLKMFDRASRECCAGA